LRGKLPAFLSKSGRRQERNEGKKRGKARRRGGWIRKKRSLFGEVEFWEEDGEEKTGSGRTNVFGG